MNISFTTYHSILRRLDCYTHFLDFFKFLFGYGILINRENDFKQIIDNTKGNRSEKIWDTNDNNRCSVNFSI